MRKFKHGFPVSSAVMVGFLHLHNKVPKDHLKPLAAAMIMSEELGQNIDRMAQMFKADLGLARSFKSPEYLDAPTVWAWRFEGFQIIRETAMWIGDELQRQATLSMNEMGRMTRANLASRIVAMTEALKSKLKKEQKLLDEAVRMGVTR